MIFKAVISNVIEQKCHEVNFSATLNTQFISLDGGAVILCVTIFQILLNYLRMGKYFSYSQITEDLDYFYLIYFC